MFKNGKIDPAQVLFHLTGVAIVIFVVGYGAFSFVSEERIVGCTERYPSPIVMAMQNPDGRLYSPVEFKSYIGRAQRGLVENATPRHRQTSNGREAYLDVRMEKGTSAGYQSKEQPGGVGFVWAPQSLKAAESACLSYEMKLPTNFDFGAGGLLPGIYGGKPLRADQSASGKPAMAARLTWNRDGKAAALIQSPVGGTAPKRLAIRADLPRQRWFRVQQEVVMNDPGQSNGVLRVWIDGKLSLENRFLEFRKDEKVGVSGVISEITYGGPQIPVGAPANANVALSPFALRWEAGAPERKAASKTGGGIVSRIR